MVQPVNDTLADRGGNCALSYGVSPLSMAPNSCGVAKENGLFAAVLTNVQTCGASSQKIAPVLNIFLHVKIFFLSHLTLMEQAKLSSDVLSEL